MYHSISDLPLSVFIQCDTEGVLTGLVKSGTPTDIELDEAWHDIQSQYAEAVGDQERQLSLKLIKQIGRLTATIQQVETLVYWLRNYYVKEFARELNRVLGTSFVFDPADGDTYDKLLDRCLKRTKSLHLELKLAADQFEAIQKKYEGQERGNKKEYYLTVLNVLSRHNGYRIHAHEITVFEYIDLLRQMNREAETLKNKK